MDSLSVPLGSTGKSPEHTGNAGILRRVLWRLGCLIHSTVTRGTWQFVVNFFLPAFHVCFLEELLFPGEERQQFLLNVCLSF